MRAFICRRDSNGGGFDVTPRHLGSFRHAWEVPRFGNRQQNPAVPFIFDWIYTAQGHICPFATLSLRLREVSSGTRLNLPKFHMEWAVMHGLSTASNYHANAIGVAYASL